ncbi:MAG TPA: CoA transferase [Tepidiformaceae bacterium]|nr:CoA transferase [Tepidiformaceae bacterium]
MGDVPPLQGVLSGVKVLDFSEYIAGPLAGQLLADLGADVTKVEPPHGDFWRHTAPVAPFESRGFMGVNKGKRSISLDLKHPGAKEVLHRLVRNADVVIANYRPGVAARIGVDYEALNAINPRIIYCENTAFGAKGPYADRAGFDLVSQAMTGIMSFEGAGGLPHPIITTSPTDLAAGFFMAYGVAAALYQRERTGVGQRIETSLFASGLAIQYRPIFSIENIDRGPREELLASFARAREEGRRAEDVIKDHPSRHDALRRANPYYKVYETRDSYIALACLNNRLRRAAAAVLGVDDPRVEGDEFNVETLGADETLVLSELIKAIFTNKTTDEWVAEFDAAGVPCGAVRMTAELFDDPQVVEGDLIVELEHALLGPVKMANSPLRMSAGETGSRMASPVLGQHTREVLAEAGYTPGEITALESSRVVRSWQRPD